MEMALLIGIPRRYDFAQAFLKHQQADANASTADPCYVVSEALASLISSYIDGLKTCYALETSGQSKSPSYRDEVELAKRIEKVYANDVVTCKSFCSDQTMCEGPAPGGACQVGR